MVATIAVLHSAAFLWGVAQLRPGARRTLARELEAAGAAPPAEPEASPVLRDLPPDADAGPVPGAPPAATGAIGVATMAAAPARAAVGRGRRRRRRRGRGRWPPGGCPRGTTARRGRRWAPSPGSAPASTRPRPAGPQLAAGPRAPRAHRPGRPARRAGARRRGPGPAHVPPRRSRRGCTSTRSTTPAPPRSSCRTGGTASTTTSTSGPTPTSPSTRWRSGSSRSRATTSPGRGTSACRSSTRPWSRGARTRPAAAT